MWPVGHLLVMPCLLVLDRQRDGGRLARRDDHGLLWG